MTTIKVALGVVVAFGSLYSHALILPFRHPSITRQNSIFLCRNRQPSLSVSSQETGFEVAIGGVSDGVSFTDKLLGRLYRNDTTRIVVEGYVTSKRSIGKNLAFLDFQVNHDDSGNNDSTHNLCQALLRTDIYSGDFHDGYRRCLLKGCKFKLTGVASPTRIPGNVVLMLHSMELIGLPRQAQHIQIILQQAVDRSIPFEEVIKACSVAQHIEDENSIVSELEDCRLSLEPHQSVTDNNGENSIEDSIIEIGRRKAVSRRLKELSKEILSALPHDPQYPLAADQRTLSKEGNFIVPPAPIEWQTVPKEIQCLENATKSKLEEELSITGILSEIKTAESTDCRRRVSITGWVQNRRRFDGNITMIYLVDNMSVGFENPDQSPSKLLADSYNRLPCLVHPDVLSGDGQHDSGMYQSLIAAGCKVRVEGSIVLSNRNQKGSGNDDTDGHEPVPSSPLVLWVESLRMIRSSYRSVTIRHLLDLLFEKRIDPEEASEALLLPYEEAKELSFQSDATERQWKANLVAIELQKEQSSKKKSMSRIDPVFLQVIEKYKYLSKIHPVIETDIEEEDHNGIESGEKKESSSLFVDGTNLTSRQGRKKRIALGMPGSKWEIKKKPQLIWMSQQIRDVLESHPEFQKRQLTILDIGGGKGQLANYLGKKLGQHVRVHVVDISQGAVKNGKKKADRLDLPVDFQFADASSSNLLDAVDADVVVALHACGHLSDVALNHAIHRDAGFVIVPCCFNSNPHLMIPDSSANNKLTAVPDWLGLPPGDWSALKLLAEVQGDIPLASEAISLICAIRAEAAKKKIAKNDDEEDSNFTVSRKIDIKSFPIQYSTRNTVLVGKCS